MRNYISYTQHESQFYGERRTYARRRRHAGWPHATISDADATRNPGKAAGESTSTRMAADDADAGARDYDLANDHCSRNPKPT